MKWFKENPFLAGLAAFTLVGVGVLGFLLSQAMTRAQEATDGYTQAVQKLHTLQNRVPFPSQENLDKSRAISQQYKAALNGLHTKLAASELPLEASVAPQQFQDNLRAAVNDIQNHATQAGVELPKDFYLGFDKYANSLPGEKAAPALSRQLAVIKQIVGKLIDFKVRSVDMLVRGSLPEEAGAQAPVGRQQPGGGTQGRNNPAERAPNQRVLERYPFDVAFTAEQGKFRVVFNSLIENEQFLVIRSVGVQNTNPAGPPISTAENPSGPSPDGSGTEGPKTLNVLLGREFVKVEMRLEMIDFSQPAQETK